MLCPCGLGVVSPLLPAQAARPIRSAGLMCLGERVTETLSRLVEAATRKRRAGVGLGVRLSVCRKTVCRSPL